jgi:hypothetical protein
MPGHGCTWVQWLRKNPIIHSVECLGTDTVPEVSATTTVHRHYIVISRNQSIRRFPRSTTTPARRPLSGPAVAGSAPNEPS